MNESTIKMLSYLFTPGDSHLAGMTFDMNEGLLIIDTFPNQEGDIICICEYLVSEEADGIMFGAVSLEELIEQIEYFCLNA